MIANGIVTITKFIGFAFSGSSALLAEAVHSLADTANQSLLFLGIKRSSRVADKKYPFGYGQERYFWNLVSAVTTFFLGCAYTVMHSLEQMESGHTPEISLLAFCIIGFVFLLGMLLSAYTSLAIFDTAAALGIALLMGCLAVFLAATNKKCLLNVADEAIDGQTLALWTKNKHIQDVRHIHSIVMSPSVSIVMAEVE